METRTQDPAGYYVWEVPGQPVIVHLRLDVVDRLAAEVMRGFGAVPKRGAEVGGVLIGTTACRAFRRLCGSTISRRCRANTGAGLRICSRKKTGGILRIAGTGCSLARRRRRMRWDIFAATRAMDFLSKRKTWNCSTNFSLDRQWSRC